MRRLFDVALAGSVLVLASPLLAAGMAGVKLSSPGPVFHRAERIGRGGRTFRMLKLRSMHLGAGAAITAGRDPRVFPFGRLIRALKIDELPQMWNVLRGDMAIVGPRPEDPGVVARHYTGWMRETLAVRPGLTGPGSIHYYGWGEDLVDPADPEGSYAAHLLPPKLALERAYMERATLLSDISITALTALAILGRVLGRPVPPPAIDVERARTWAEVPMDQGEALA